MSRQLKSLYTFPATQPTQRIPQWHKVICSHYLPNTSFSFLFLSHYHSLFVICIW
jgi:hypothetical protein